MLGVIHGDFDTLDQRGGVDTVIRVGGDPGAGGDIKGVTIGNKRGAKTLQQHARGDGRIVVVQTAQNKTELVAADPSKHVRVAQASLQAFPDQAQQRVTHVVPQGVVDVLELIQIHEQHRERSKITLRPVDLAPEQLEVARPIGQVGDRIRQGTTSEAVKQAVMFGKKRLQGVANVAEILGATDWGHCNNLRTVCVNVVQKRMQLPERATDQNVKGGVGNRDCARHEDQRGK